jgi:hypothetical protein
MKKLLMIFLVLTATGVSAYGFGIGVEGSGSWVYNMHGAPWGGALSFGIGEMQQPSGTGSVIFGLNRNFFWLGAHYKWHFFAHNFTDWLQFFTAVGPQVGVGFGSGNFEVNIAARLSLGLRFLFAEHVDIFLSLDPSVGLNLSAYDSVRAGLYAGVGGTLGLRFWF